MYEIKLDNRKEYIKYNPHETVIGEGGISNVYLYKNMALKIYKYDLSFQDLYKFKLNKLKSLNLKRIIVPQNIIYDKNKKIIGYTMPYIDGSNGDSLINYKCNYLYNELKLIMDDIKVLSQNNIILDDLHNGNVIVNNLGIFFIDSDDYLFKMRCSYDKNLHDNIFMLNRFLKYGLLTTNLDYRKIALLNKSFNDYADFSIILKEHMQNDEKIAHFVKRLIKSRW